MNPFSRVVLPYVPADFMTRYSYNELMVATKRPPNAGYRGRCYDCGVRGVLWVDLKFYGFPRPRNFLCGRCWDAMSMEEKHRRRIADTVLFLRCRERRLARLVAGMRRKAP